LLALAVLAGLWIGGSTLGAPLVRAEGDSPDPLSMLLTNEDAGADATVTNETQGEEGQAHWARRRWERDAASQDGASGSKDRDPKDPSSRSRGNASSYETSGPLVLENIVYVGRDLAAAKQVYANEVGKQSTFPEATDRLSGNFPFPMTSIGDESSALSGCNDCMAKDEIYVHRRTVVRKGPVVTVVYTYGNDKVITEDLATWFAGQAASHIPDDIVVAAGPRASAPASAGSPDESQPAPEGQPGAESQSQPQAIQTRPQDLVVKIDEAGKGAEKKDEKDGSDDRSQWYQVRYERPRTFAGYRAGPVTVFSQVFVAKDRAAADQIYQEQASQNEKFPEAKEKVGGVFELKGASGIGDESRGLSACNTACNSNKEIYLHKRIVTRVENVVSVVYIWGLDNQEGVTDDSAPYFAGLVVRRIGG
jgi:hypothetical protein